MDGFHAAAYGDGIADLYDSFYGDLDPGPAVDTLAGLAGAGPALELGIGTGRLALPLASRGIAVHGIDASEAMVEVLRSKPGGRDVPVTITDFADFSLGSRYRLIFVAFNTFLALRNQDEQAGCLAAVARHLAEDGRFAVEVFVPDLSRFDRDQRVDVSSITSERVVINASRHDPVAQTVTTQHIVITEEGIRLIPVAVRYVYPRELDLLAAGAGLELEARWAGWNRSPFTSGSVRHVSVYRPAQRD